MNMATSIEIARKTKKLNRKRKRMKDGKPPRSIKLILNLGKGLVERPKIQIRSKLLQPLLQTSHLSKPPLRPTITALVFFKAPRRMKLMKPQ